jgi:hypothetical protein
LDCFFYEGPDILFPIALAIFKINEESIMSGKDGSRIAKKMKDHIYDSDELLDVLIILVILIYFRLLSQNMQIFQQKKSTKREMLIGKLSLNYSDN